jgi:hypothetical protein
LWGMENEKPEIAPPASRSTRYSMGDRKAGGMTTVDGRGKERGDTTAYYHRICRKSNKRVWFS